MTGAQRTIRTDGVEIATEAFGDPTHRPVLLVMGVMASMLWWPERFCEQLAATGRFVIRYDNRDTGLSTTYEQGKPGYSFDDMADDAIRVLDGYGIARGDIVGMSMGGMLAQLAALRHPDRVATLTLMSTSPYAVEGLDLPGSTAAYRKHSAEGEKVDWTDMRQVADHMVGETRVIAGSAFPYDEAAARALIERDIARARNFASATNHFILSGGEGFEGKLRDLGAPLLVIHGTADPIFPIEHGEAFRHIVKGARLVALDRGGHELHPGHWPTIIDAIATHT